MDRSDQLSKVLNRCDQQILDRLFDQPPPASAFETMSVGSVSKTTFHQMLPAFPIESGSLGIGLSTRSIQEVLIAMAFNEGTREIRVILYAKEPSYVPRLRHVTKGSPRG